ncbi:nuclease-related domain-containing protein [Alteribacter keqinensis]|uniref:NERD domain-containing protein n=1 Tax=Alteribacter keqinensis TaxID=2483800 RepID=A0A3M7TQV9_9BACI|nr:nuclease-related domain-containing protein [Alteribacter keqinensis]RNA67811.1 NERD domain-containing protein [Alteribacter keqinensis]
MFIKPIQKPAKLLQYEALSRRLADSHPKKEEIVARYHSERSGFKGEESMGYYLNSHELEQWKIFHNIKLHDGSSTFQIDFLLVSPTLISILEIKNISGKLRFEPDLQQVIWTNKQGIVKILPDFVIQVNTQKRKLAHWLRKNKYPNISIAPLVIITNPRCLLEVPDHCKKHSSLSAIIRNSLFPSKFSNLIESHNDLLLKKLQLNKLTKHILREDVSSGEDVLSKYAFSLTDLHTGFYCRKCENFSNEKRRQSWRCIICGQTITTQEPLLQALRDYKYLFNHTISNQQFRWFTNSSSRADAYYLLKSLNLPTTGAKKSTTYDLTDL